MAFCNNNLPTYTPCCNPSVIEKHKLYDPPLGKKTGEQVKQQISHVSADVNLKSLVISQ